MQKPKLKLKEYSLHQNMNPTPCRLIMALNKGEAEYFTKIMFPKSYRTIEVKEAYPESYSYE